MEGGAGRASFLDNHDMDRFLFLAGGRTDRLKLAALERSIGAASAEQRRAVLVVFNLSDRLREITVPASPGGATYRYLVGTGMRPPLAVAGNSVRIALTAGSGAAFGVEAPGTVDGRNG